MILGGARINRIARPDLPGEIVNTYGPSTRVHRQSWPDGTRLDFSYKIVGACVYNTASPTQRCTDATCPSEDNATTAAAGWRFVGGRVVSTAVSDAVGVLYTQRFNSNRVAVEYIDAQGQSWKYERDANNRVAKTTDPLGRVTRFATDENGNRTRIIDPANRVTEVTYTLTGITKPTAVRRFRDDGTSIFWQFGFNQTTGNLTSSRDPVGNIASFEYFPTTNLLKSIRTQAGRTTSLQYNSQGEPTKVTDPLGRDVAMDWDSSGRMASVTDPLGNATNFAYNARHQLTTVTDSHQGVTTLAYDSSTRLASVTDR